MEIVIAVLVLHALVSASFCAYLASQKGRDGTSWFLLGLLFGLVALIVLVGVPSDTQRLADLKARAEAAEERRAAEGWRAAEERRAALEQRTFKAKGYVEVRCLPCATSLWAPKSAIHFCTKCGRKMVAEGTPYLRP